MTKAEAIRYCERRWHEQVERFPTMREDISWELYLRRNLRATTQLDAVVPDNHPGRQYRD